LHAAVQDFRPKRFLKLTSTQKLEIVSEV